MPARDLPDIADVQAKLADREPALHSLVQVFTPPLAPTGSGALDGELLVVKDNIAVTGAPWMAGSATRANRAATFDAECVRRARAAGATVIGTSNLDEFAMGASTVTSCFGPTHNPWDTTRTAGGSSGGSAAAVAAYDVLAVGTDTGGSIREPASQCGIVGVKPSTPEISRHGVVPFAPSYDAVGPMAPTVARTARLDDVLRGTTALLDAVRRGHRDGKLAGQRIGVVSQMADHRNSAEVRERFRRALEVCERLGAQLVDIDVPSIADSLQTYLTTTSLEAIAVLGEHEQYGALGIEAARRLQHARDVPPQDVARAQQHRSELRTQLRAIAGRFDILISPAMPIVAPPLERLGLDDPLAVPRLDWWTVEANIAGLGAMSLPSGLGRDSGLPIGLQLMCAPGTDERIYYAAACLEPLIAD